MVRGREKIKNLRKVTYRCYEYYPLQNNYLRDANSLLGDIAPPDLVHLPKWALTENVFSLTLTEI